MAAPIADPSFYADFAGLAALKRDAHANDQAALRATAQQFESLFTDMLLQSMRQAKLGEGLGESAQTDLYQQMYDQQLALSISRGHGLGLADLLVRQLSQSRAAAGAGTSGAGADAAAGKTTVPQTAAGMAGASAGASSQAPASQRERIGFVRALAPRLQQAAQQLGVSVNSLVAQAALETGWGRHLPGGSSSRTSSHNLFGIKAGESWPGAAVSGLTAEYRQGGASTAVQSFRAYGSLRQGIDDYVGLLQGQPRYRAALGTGDDVGAFATALARGGYATDPDYVAKLVATAAQVAGMRDEALKVADRAPIQRSDAPA